MSDQVTAVDVQTLVQEGRAALMAGDAYTARARYRQALELDAACADAWVGLAGAVRPYREKREHLQRALAIDPQHIEARAILAQVEAKLAAGEILAPGGVQVREAGPAPAEAAAPPPEAPAPAAPTAILYCYIHPGRETGLRCTNCDRPICHECVRPAPVGQLCPECARIRRPLNYQVAPVNIAVAGVVALLAGVIFTVLASFVVGSIGLFFGFLVAFLLGTVAGDLLVRMVGWLTSKKRGREMQLAIGIGYTFGALPWTTLIALMGGFPLALVAFTVILVTTAIARIR